MALYLISYDINEKDAFEYEGLWAKLRSLGAVRILYSEWAMTADAAQTTPIYDAVASTIQSKDRLLVHELANNATWNKLLLADDAFKKLVTENARG